MRPHFLTPIQKASWEEALWKSPNFITFSNSCSVFGTKRYLNYKFCHSLVHCFQYCLNLPAQYIAFFIGLWKSESGIWYNYILIIGQWSSWRSIVAWTAWSAWVVVSWSWWCRAVLEWTLLLTKFQCWSITSPALETVGSSCEQYCCPRDCSDVIFLKYSLYFIYFNM